MRTLFLYVILLAGGLSGKEKSLSLAADAFQSGDFHTSILHYGEALKAYPAQAARIQYNIGQCYRELDSTDRALQFFHEVLDKNSPDVASLASNEIGLLMIRRQRTKEALEAFREALVYDPENENARYNYELLRKRMKGNNPPQQPPPPPRPPSPQDEEDTPEEDEETAPDDNLPEDYRDMIRQIIQRQRQSNSTNDFARPIGSDTISLFQARRILESMRQNEIQYLQQLRKSAATPHKNGGAPDW
ncbi:MAG: tetratricopeptide repeat protein [Bacteroidia bacterium]|nr:tetratricopeptide repeat protein [Bacteroidia bacterium]